MLLPQHLLKELLQSLHGTAHRHPVILKAFQEIRQRYYHPSMAKHGKRWVEGCRQCAKDKQVPNATITPELLNFLDWDIGPEDAMIFDLLPIFPQVEDTKMSFDVFSRDLFPYPPTDASAVNVAKVSIDIM